MGWHVADASYGGFPSYDLIPTKIQYHNSDKYLETISRKPRKTEKVTHYNSFLLRFFCLHNIGGAELVVLFCNPLYIDK